MRRLFWGLMLATTLLGGGLFIVPGGSWPWWDPTWIILFFVAAYVEVATRCGLSSARMACGLVILVLAVVLAVFTLTGWPFGPINFTERAGLTLGGAIPLVLPLFGFAVLATCHEGLEALQPAIPRAWLSLCTSVGFLLTLANGLSFFTADRVWWISGGLSFEGALTGAVVFLVLNWGLAWSLPSHLHTSRRRISLPLAGLAATNALFLAANFAKVMR